MAVAQGQEKFSHPKGWTQLPTAKLPSGDRRRSVVWLRDHMLDPMVVFQKDHLGTDTCKPI